MTDPIARQGSGSPALVNDAGKMPARLLPLLKRA
jgi:hypothetical protein